MFNHSGLQCRLPPPCNSYSVLWLIFRMTPSRTLLQILIGLGWRGSTCSKKKTCYDFNTPLDCELYFGDMQVTGQPLGFQSGLKESATKKMDFLLFLCIFEVLVAQSCPTLCDPMDCRLFCPWNSPKNTRVGCHSLLQGIFLTQGSNPGLLHCRQILHPWATREAPCFFMCISFPEGLEWVCRDTSTHPHTN